MVKLKQIKLKRIVWILLLVSIFSLVLFSPASVQARNEIESIQIEATIQENGSVLIRDHRIFYADEGTEHYIALGNLGESELLSFVVYDENNKALEDVGDWNVNASFAQKAGKYGVNRTGQGIELCFGLGAYGRREFTLEYELSNFIFNLADNHQAFYWQFINPDMDPLDSIEINVKNETAFEFVNPETRFWGFGHEGGTTQITNGSLIFKSGDSFRQSDYVVLLGIFEGAPFPTNYSLDRTSEEQITMAMEGAQLDEDEGDFKIGSIFRYIMIALLFLFPLGGAIKNANKKPKRQKFKPTVEDAYFRDIPYDNHFIYTQYFTNAEVSDWISAFILKWVSEGRLIDQVEEVGLIFKRDKLELKIVPNLPQAENELESRLWNMVVEAAGEDQILSEKEFNSYVKKNISSFNSWTESVESKSETVMTYESYLEEFSEKVLKVFTRKRLEITPKGQELGDNIVGFKNYLKDFSLLEERGVSHVGLWQDFMIWAAFMGIAEEVYEQLKIVNPQVEYQMPYSTQTILMTHYFANAVQSTQRSANAASSARGAGGSSFGGGGGGSFGGGMGGGSR
ncbi:MAG: DUF2207 domain-containing protein [Eubacteriales bacterium]|nr:DUF2207 domain-containing protein [Eubacteriales bacterium]